VITVVCGLIGVPPVNGVIPQSPMHTRALLAVKSKKAARRSPPPSRPGSAASQRGGGGGGGGGPPQSAFATHPDGGSAHSNGGTTASSSAAAAALEPAAPDGAAPADADLAVALSAAEQRGSGLLQSLALGGCLAATPAIRCVPTSVLWGYFAFMAAESLPGMQLWDRVLLLLTDPKRCARSKLEL
jgi:hypothetical protein